jgi:hypothetical protein
MRAERDQATDQDAVHMVPAGVRFDTLAGVCQSLLGVAEIERGACEVRKKYLHPLPCRSAHPCGHGRLMPLLRHATGAARFLGLWRCV